jgi:hypothetical protein
VTVQLRDELVIERALVSVGRRDRRLEALERRSFGHPSRRSSSCSAAGDLVEVLATRRRRRRDPTEERLPRPRPVALARELEKYSRENPALLKEIASALDDGHGYERERPPAGVPRSRGSFGQAAASSSRLGREAPP